MVENNCVFCNRDNLGDRIIAERDNLWIVATIGQITDSGYTLIIPKEHIPCSGALPQHRTGNLTDQMVQTRSEVKHALSREYGTAFITSFEHGIVGQTIKHAHEHFLPQGFDLTPRIKADFPEANVVQLMDETHLQILYRRQPEPYLSWTAAEGETMVCWNPTEVPLMYLRIITAEMLGHPERANWRTMDPELDKKLQQETVARLKPYLS